MSRFGSRRHRRVLAGALGIAVAAAVLASSAGAVAPIGPVPTPDHSVTLSASPVVGLADGSAITFTVNTAGGTTLVGNITAHLCQHGFSSYGASNFGYDGSFASRCVYSGHIVSGTLTGGEYEHSYGPYSGSQTTSGPLTFLAGTGAVNWGTDDGFGPFTVTADLTHQVDLVIQVNVSGDSVPVTYFIQPLSFGNPATAPQAPTGVKAVPRAATVGHTGPISVSYNAPANGGSPITSFTATCKSSNGGATKTGVHTGATAAPITVGGADLKRFYTCRVTATNAVGTSVASTPSAVIAVGAPAQVFKPSISKIKPGKLKVSFANLNGLQTNGGALTTPQYTAKCTSTNGGVTKAATGAKGPLGVPGLTRNKNYTCTVKAHNGRGYGQTSVASAAHSA